MLMASGSPAIHGNHGFTGTVLPVDSLSVYVSRLKRVRSLSDVRTLGHGATPPAVLKLPASLFLESPARFLLEGHHT
jgi:hypothetical protein